MIFLIEYDRDLGRILTIEPFNSSDRKTAEELRFARELDLNRKGIEHEVVLLEAATEDALRRTHSRYFEGLAELITAPAIDESSGCLRNHVSRK